VGIVATVVGMVVVEAMKLSIVDARLEGKGKEVGVGWWRGAVLGGVDCGRWAVVARIVALIHLHHRDVS
jgi:hypothetical protein